MGDPRVSALWGAFPRYQATSEVIGISEVTTSRKGRYAQMGAWDAPH